MSIDNDTVTPIPPPPGAGPTSVSGIGEEERTWALAAHLSSFAAFVSGIGMVLGPLIVWLVKRDTMPFVAEQAREALNFNLTLLLIGVALVLLSVMTLGFGFIVTVPIGLALFVAWVILTIVAAVNAHNGVHYRYPFAWRLIQ